MSIIVPPPPMAERFKNSPTAIARFPFPFIGDSYEYTVNLVKCGQGAPGSFDEHWFDVDEHYVAEMELREQVLAEDPERCLALPHTMDHQWDLVELIMEHYSADYPEHFSLTRDGDRWTWENRLLGITDTFTFGDPLSLPRQPLDYIARQAQGDWVLLDQRDGDFWLDAGMLTFPADWSLKFDLGMSFEEWHGPVPMAHEAGVFKRAKEFLKRIRPEEPWQRFNWTMTIGRRWDTSSETYDKWGPERTTITPENVGEKVHLRVEVQVLPRLARSNGLLFLIRTYLISLDELVTNPAWAKRLRRVLMSLPNEIADYKGLSRYKDTVIAHLAPYDPP
jgi:dimethylamine monooxygenase subunit A